MRQRSSLLKAVITAFPSVSLPFLAVPLRSHRTVAIRAGERDLAALTAGLDAGSARLMTLVFFANHSEFDLEARAEFAEKLAGGGSVANSDGKYEPENCAAFFTKHVVSFRRIRQLADADTALVDAAGAEVQPRFVSADTFSICACCFLLMARC
eukprot:SAG22_NODE_3550_length_1649_cov_3.387742_2_plen_154_part_00